jgi:c-di-GMP-binding flagellar brake protein YcgR
VQLSKKILREGVIHPITKTQTSERTMTNEEKRKHSRIDSLNLLNYVYSDESGDGSTQGMGRTLNVSESGILLETHTPIDVNNVISLTIGFEEDVVEIKGRIIYTKENENKMSESGIEFFDIDDIAKETLKKYIAAFNARQNNP